VKQTESELLTEMLASSQAVKENENEAQKPSELEVTASILFYSKYCDVCKSCAHVLGGHR
jgi:hypothetical protein